MFLEELDIFLRGYIKAYTRLRTRRKHLFTYSPSALIFAVANTRASSRYLEFETFNIRTHWSLDHVGIYEDL